MSNVYCLGAKQKIKEENNKLKLYGTCGAEAEATWKKKKKEKNAKNNDRKKLQKKDKQKNSMKLMLGISQSKQYVDVSNCCGIHAACFDFIFSVHFHTMVHFLQDIS